MKISSRAARDMLDASLEYAQNEKTKDGKVILSKIVLIIGAILTLACLIPIIILALKGSVFPEIIFLGFFCLFGFFIMLGYFNCRIYYDDDGFTHKNIIGIKKRYDYADVSGIRKSEKQTYVFVGKKKILVDAFAVGGRDFIKFINRKYNQVYGKNVPDIPAPKKDIFKGNLVAPEDIKVAFIIAYVIIAVMGIFLFCLGSSDSDKTEAVYDTIASCETFSGIGRDNLDVYSQNGKKYIIHSVPNDFDISKIERLCDGKTQVKLDVIESKTKNGDINYTVRALSADGENILSRAETWENEKYLLRSMTLLIAGGIGGLLTLFLLIIIFAARNAEKYPKLALAVFKKSQLTIYNNHKIKSKNN